MEMLSNADEKQTKDVEGNTRKPSVTNQRGCVTHEKKRKKKVLYRFERKIPCMRAVS